MTTNKKKREEKCNFQFMKVINDTINNVVQYNSHLLLFEIYNKETN
jgi:hypothetical protein